MISFHMQKRVILSRLCYDQGPGRVGEYNSRRKRVKDMLDRLVNLQETDEKIVAFQREEEEIPLEIQEKEKSVGLLEEEHNQIQATLDDLENQISDLNLELDEVRDQQRRSQARALAVKTQREYQAVQREAEIARKRRGELEAQIKEFLEEKGVIADSSLEVKSRIGDQAKILKKERGAADSRLKKIQGARKDLEKTRSVEAGLIDPVLLGKYQKVFQRYRGKGVVLVSGGVCNGCFMTIPPQLYNQVLAQGGVHQCPNCGRIIYVDQA
jgi:predicted  nucleic acid-binding Zn-ribbon protein